MMSQTLPLSDGRRVNLLRQGTGAPLVLIHGVGMCAEAWQPQIAALQGRYQLIALNMPGHGGSDPLQPVPVLADYVSWAAEVIRQLGLGPVNVAGHSMGALIAAGLAADHPDLVLRVALLNGVHRRSPAARAAVEARADALAAGANDIAAPLNRWFGDTPAEARIRAQVAGWLQSVSPDGYAAAYRAFATGDDLYADRWPGIACPALFLTGSGDANSTAAMAEAMAQAAPNGRAVVIPGHRHMVNLTAPDLVTAALADWLATPLSREAA